MSVHLGLYLFLIDQQKKSSFQFLGSRLDNIVTTATDKLMMNICTCLSGWVYVELFEYAEIDVTLAMVLLTLMTDISFGIWILVLVLVFFGLGKQMARMERELDRRCEWDGWLPDSRRISISISKEIFAHLAVHSHAHIHHTCITYVVCTTLYNPMQIRAISIHCGIAEAYTIAMHYQIRTAYGSYSEAVHIMTWIMCLPNAYNKPLKSYP